MTDRCFDTAFSAYFRNAPRNGHILCYRLFERHRGYTMFRGQFNQFKPNIRLGAETEEVGIFPAQHLVDVRVIGWLNATFVRGVLHLFFIQFA